MQYFPKCASLVAQYANLLLEVRHNGPLTRTQLQVGVRACLLLIGTLTLLLCSPNIHVTL